MGQFFRNWTNVRKNVHINVQEKTKMYKKQPIYDLISESLKLSNSDIAEILNCSIKTVYHYINELKFENVLVRIEADKIHIGKSIRIYENGLRKGGRNIHQQVCSRTSICTSIGEEFNLRFCVADFKKSLFFGLYNTL